MNAQAVAVTAFLALAVLAAAISAAGIVAMRTALQRLHYVGPVSTIGAAAVAAAVACANGPLLGVKIKALCIAVLVVALSPVLTHELGRAAAARAGRPE